MNAAPPEASWDALLCAELLLQARIAMHDSRLELAAESALSANEHTTAKPHTQQPPTSAAMARTTSLLCCVAVALLLIGKA